MFDELRPANYIDKNDVMQNNSCCDVRDDGKLVAYYLIRWDTGESSYCPVTVENDGFYHSNSFEVFDV